MKKLNISSDKDNPAIADQAFFSLKHKQREPFAVLPKPSEGLTQSSFKGFTFRYFMALSIMTMSGTTFGHGTQAHQPNHKDYDQFIANMVRAEEQSGSAQFSRYINAALAKLPTELMVSEAINAVLGKQANAAVGGNPALYGEWSGVTTWPFVFASAANLPDGRILAWGGNNPTTFNGGTFTYSAIWNPSNGQFVTANHPNHSLFCGIPVMLEDGRVFVDGGDNGNASSVRGTSTFNYNTQTWTRIQDLAVGRWYNGSVALPNGKVFSALGQPGSVYPEIWTQGTGWTYLNGINFQSSILDYPTITEPKNWLPHVHLAPNGKIFHSGHTPQMNYIDLTGNGSIAPVGLTNDWNTANTPSVLYDEGKILQSGGALYATGNPASGKAQSFDLNAGIPSRTMSNDMLFPRIFHNEVVLPNGEVMAVGGNAGAKFSDAASQMTPEIWNPTTRSWRVAADISVPRNYHSVALLMVDGRVWSGGGGLCGCAADHPNSQIFSPPYLFNADGSLANRPEIISAPNVVSYGVTANLTATAGVNRFTMVRMSSNTHAVNSDMRFLNVPFISTSPGQYALTFHTNRDVMVPGYWMLFALDSQGVPSIAKIIQVSTSNAPVIGNPGDQSSIQNMAVNLSIQVSNPLNNGVTFNAVGLPQGLSINSNTGVISGTPNSPQSTRVILSASNGIATASVSFVWTVLSDQTSAASAIVGDAGGTFFIDNVNANENLSGVTIRHGGWLDAIQGILNSRTLALHGGTGGTLSTATWPANEYLVRIYGLHGSNVGQISFVTNTGRVLGPYGGAQGGTNTSTFDLSAPAGREIIGFTGRSATYLNAIGIVHRSHVEPNQPPLVGTVVNQVNTLGDSINLAISASDPDGDSLTYSAIGLPSGIEINPITGVITGSPTLAGTFDVIVQAQDTKSAISGSNFLWTIYPQSLAINPPNTAPNPVNSLVTLTASVNNAVNPRFKWSFGDGTPETDYSNNPVVQHSFANPGLYAVQLTVTDDRNIISTETFIQAIHLPHTTQRSTLSSNMAISSVNGNPRLWVINQDNDTVSVFNADETKIGEIAVGKSPRSIAIAPDGRVWVANKADSTLSILDPTMLQVQQVVAMPNAAQPFGLAFAPNGNAAYVVLEALGKLAKLNPTTGEIIGSVSVGENPRHIAVHANNKVYVSRFISRPLPGESTASVQTVDNQGIRGGEVIVVNPDTMTVDSTIVIQHSDKEDTENKGSGLPNYLAMLGISPDGQTAWLPSKQDNIKRGILRNANNLNFQNTVRAIAAKLDLSVSSEFYDARIDFDNAGLASALTYDQSGNYLFVALETSREVSVVDAYGGRELRRIQVDLAPDGLVVSRDNTKLYVNNFMSRSISVIDLTNLISRGEWQAPVIKTVASVTNEKLTVTVLKGKQLFYDARDLRLASDAYMSCASCHNDGGHDGRVWDLTGFGEGLRNTIDLRGRNGTGHGFLHWTGNFDEIQDFESQIRSLAGGSGLMSEPNFAATQAPMGTPKAGLSADLDALSAYVGSLSVFQASPYRNADGSLSAQAIAGKSLFVSSGCIGCHGGNTYTDSPAQLLHNVGTIKPASGQRLNAQLTGFDAPTLRDVWNTAPYLHDGSASTLEDAILSHNTTNLNDSQIAEIAGYLKEIGASEPAAVNQPPSVAITSPNNGATITEGVATTIAVNAADADGTVMKVEFYVNNTLLATDTNAPYNFTWSGATVGNYTLTAKAYDNYGSFNSSLALSVTIQPLIRQGLLGEYFNNTTLTGTPVVQSNEAVDFNWGSGSPKPGVNTDNFSVRWSGQVTATSTGSYRFRTISDDGVRLYINGALRINNWTDHAPTTNTIRNISLVAGTKYNITMEYYERGGGATARLQWLTPGQTTYNAIPLEQLSNTDK